MSRLGAFCCALLIACASVAALQSGPKDRSQPHPPKKSQSKAQSNPERRVYVRGYYRKDGTYVRPHTRSRPHAKGGSSTPKKKSPKRKA
jgi:hypothetical protein